MKKTVMLLLASMLIALSAYAGKGKIRVGCDVEEAYIYVNGKKKAMTGEGFTNLLLEEGEYEIKVQKDVDDEWYLFAKKKVFVGEDTSSKINFKLKKLPTAKREARLKKKYALYPRVTKNIIHDKKRDLMWQDNGAASSTEKTWKGAKAYCKKLSLDGYSDWRLPSYDELLTIVDYDRYNPTILPLFKNVASSYYWSSSPNVSNSKEAWYVSFNGGSTSSNGKSRKYYVRCVRGRQ